MFEQQTATAKDAGQPAAEAKAAQRHYRRPNLEFVGTVVQIVQSGPRGNRNETYQGSYWYDR